MKKSPIWLQEYSSNVHSQSGEDGIIAKIMELLPERDNWCVEFGAWDGVHLSNTRNLIDNQGYSAVLIEADKKRFENLKQRCSQSPGILVFNRFVGFQSQDNLDSILRETPITKDFDLLSIDIDGNDYHVWAAMKDYSPKVVCVEYNPTIPTEVHFVQSAEPGIHQGCGLSDLVDLGKQKNYELVAVTPLNAIFVKSEYYEVFGIKDNRPEVLRTDLSAVTYIFSGYDGAVFIRGNRKLLWHDIKFSEERVQQLPRWLRCYPPDYGHIQAKLIRLLRWFSGKTDSKVVKKLEA